MAQTNIPLLAPEIIDAIVGYLHREDWDVAWEDVPRSKLDLHSCSLVSHSWNAITLRHLFRDVPYSFRATKSTDPSPYEYPSAYKRNWSEFLFTRQHVRFKTLPMLCAFLRDNPGIQRHIQSLKLELWPSHQPTNSFIWPFGPGDEVDSETFIELMSLLPRLRILHLHNVFISNLPDTVAPPNVSLARLQVATVSVANIRDSVSVWVEPESVLEHTLSFFQEVDELHLATWNLKFSESDPEENDEENEDGDLDEGGDEDEEGDPSHTEHPDGAANKPQGSELSVRHLVLEGLSREPKRLSKMLGSGASHLRRLTLLPNLLGSEEFPLVSQTFLDLIAQNLQDLGIFVGTGQKDDSNMELEELDLSRMTNLRRLRTSLVMNKGMKRQHEEALSSFIKIARVADGAREYLEEIILELAVDEGIDVDDSVFARLGSVLATFSSPGQCKVFVEVIPLSAESMPIQLPVLSQATLEAALREHLGRDDLIFRSPSGSNWLEYYPSHSSHNTWTRLPA